MTNPGNGPQARLTSAYDPPDRGVIPTSSATTLAVNNANRPPATQSNTKINGSVTTSAISPGVRKIPKPMMPPMVIANENPVPSIRLGWCCVSLLVNYETPVFVMLSEFSFAPSKGLSQFLYFSPARLQIFSSSFSTSSPSGIGSCDPKICSTWSRA